MHYKNSASFDSLLVQKNYAEKNFHITARLIFNIFYQIKSNFFLNLLLLLGLIGTQLVSPTWAPIIFLVLSPVRSILRLDCCLV